MANGQAWLARHTEILSEMAGKFPDTVIADEIAIRTGTRFSRGTISRRRMIGKLPNAAGAFHHRIDDPVAFRQFIEERLSGNSMPEPNSGCLLWLGPVTPFGHGLMAVPGRGTQPTHRMAWEAAHGPIPDGLHVCHRCDVASCINIDHLWLGTARDNMLDKHAKGRSNNPRGEKHGRAKLLDVQVIDR